MPQVSTKESVRVARAPGYPGKNVAGQTRKRRRKTTAKRGWTWLILVILGLGCANIAGLWALWSSSRAEGIAGRPGFMPTLTPELFALPAPGLPAEPTPTATRVVIITPTATDTPPPASTSTPTATPPPAATSVPVPTLPATPAPVETSHVIIITIDGLRPDALALADTPTLDSLIARGAYTPQAQTLWLSRTLPAHASLLTGMLPEKHGIIWGEPYIGWPGMTGPTLFNVAHEAGLSTAMVFGKEKLNYLVLPNSVDSLFSGDVSDAEVKDRAVRLIEAGLPAVTFIHFPDVDRVGHAYGWMSENQLQAVTFVDGMLGEIVAALEQGGYMPSTLLIITADHGGHGKNHGDDSPVDRTIPWLAVGPGIPAGFTPTRTINIYDTAPTVVHALKLPIPPIWDGQPVLEIFTNP